MTPGAAGGPLRGIRVLELAGVGPAPFGVMLLADYGAEVIRVDRITETVDQGLMHSLSRGRRSIGIDVKQLAGRELVLRLAETVDVFVDPFRPGVTERLGFGPDACLDRNGRLVYARMTGWGQTGPLASQAGHDLNYLALTGVLHALGRKESAPPPPLNVVADGAGALYLALGVIAALWERETSGRGQVLDVAMVDGVTSLMTMYHAMIAEGSWSLRRQSNVLDGGRPFYDTYETADGHYMAVGALEPHFFGRLLDTLRLDSAKWPQNDSSLWPDLSLALAETFRSRTREEWTALFADVDACVTPVLTLEEAARHEHAVARDAFISRTGRLEPAPAPRFGRTPAQLAQEPPARGQDTRAVLAELGLSGGEIEQLIHRSVAG